MLTLKRAPYESIFIGIAGRRVKLIVWPISKGQVKVAVEAPSDIPIVRLELRQKNQKGRRN